MEAEILERLARIETHLESLVGNGQPGRIAIIEKSVQSLRESRASYAGIVWAVSAGLSIAGSWIFTHLFGK